MAWFVHRSGLNFKKKRTKSLKEKQIARGLGTSGAVIGYFFFKVYP